MVKKVLSKGRHICCMHCDTELEFEDSDVFVGTFGAECIKCPECDFPTFATVEADRLTLPHFPETFYHTGDLNNAKSLSDEEVNQYLNDCIRQLSDFPDLDNTSISSGDTIIIANRYEDEIVFYVAKKYYEDTVSIDDWNKLTC